MKKISYYLLALLTLFSCKQNKAESEVLASSKNDLVESTFNEYPVFNWDTLKGNYYAKFGDNILHLNLKHVTEFNAVGDNIVNGLTRNINGKVTQDDNFIFLELAELGDNPNDGIFHIMIDKESLKISGKWTPYSTKLKEKEFKLTKKITFDYDKDLEKMQGDEKITEYTFQFFFGKAMDSHGDYTFFTNGLVEFSYHPLSENKTGFMANKKTALGSWLYKNNVLTIEWQQDAPFIVKNCRYILKDERDLQDDENLYFQFNDHRIYTSEQYY